MTKWTATQAPEALTRRPANRGAWMNGTGRPRPSASVRRL
jgi:hypothetical protein